MEDLKFDKRDLDMILDCLDDFQYESCKEVCANPYFETPRTIASDVHGLIFKYSHKKEQYIELYMAVNPNQKEFFHCPKCKRILNVHVNRKYKDEKNYDPMLFDLGKCEEVFFCKDCGWTGGEAPFEEVKVGGNQAE